MGATFADLIADVESDLYSFTQGNDQASWLTSAIGAADTTIAVNDASMFDSGFAEITSTAGNEVIYISSKDEQAQTITVPPWGRAQRGSVALAHPSNSRIVADPQFPRSKIAQFINEAVLDTYPTLFAVDFVDIGLVRGTELYGLPADCDGLIDVQVSNDRNPQWGWRPLRRMAFYLNDRTINVTHAGRDWHTMRVTYRHAPRAFSALTDTLAGIGYSDFERPVIRWGAYYKALNMLQGQKLQLSSVEAAAMVQLRQPDYLNNTLKTVFAQYQVALQSAQDRLRQKYPPLRYKLP